MRFASELNALRNCPRYKFSDWEQDKKNIPIVAAGVYIVWLKNLFLYAGMAGENLTSADINTILAQRIRAKGLRRRLAKHASGNRGGNLFCVYICDMFVIPRLSKSDIHKLKRRQILLDGKKGLIKGFVRGHLKYQFVSTKDGRTAAEFESFIREGKSFLGKPFINPK